MEVRLLSRKEIESLQIPVTEVMDVVEKGFALKGKDAMEMPAKIGIHPRKDCFIHAMPCFVGGGADVAGISGSRGIRSTRRRVCPTSPESCASTTRRPVL